MQTMKKYILLFLFGTIVFSACEKIDLTNGYELPEGWIRGTLVWADDQSVASDLYLMITNEDTGATDFTFSMSDGTFKINRMVEGNYSMIVFNDSIITTNPVTFSLGDGEDKDLGNISVEVAPYPEISNITLQTATSSSFDLRVDVEENGNAVWGRGIYYLPASDPSDLIEEGEDKTTKYPPNREYWETTISGLDPDTQYRMKAYVYIKRGVDESGSTNYVYIYSEEYTFSTDPAK